MKFKLLKDLTINTGFEETLIFKCGTIIEPNEDGEYTFPNLKRKYTLDELKSKPLYFEEYKPLNMIVDEITSSDDEVKNWRIQVDVKTSLTNLKKIQRIIEETIQKNS